MLPYQCDPSFKNREDLEQFLKGCDNRVESNSDSEDENVDLEGWKDIKKDCTCGRCGDITSNGFEHLCCQQIDKWKKNALGRERTTYSGTRSEESGHGRIYENFLVEVHFFM